jgi:formylmethanofuran dehydrogenase subunit E
MGYTKEKVAYLRGVADGMELGDDKYAKLFHLIIETLDEMADTVDENEEAIIEMDECIDDMCDELSDIDECLDALLDDDDLDEDEDDDFIEIECPHCGETVYFDQSMLEGDDPLICPNCNQPVVPDLSDDEDE